VVIFCVLYFRYLDAKDDGRLDEGIDPAWTAEKPKEPAPA
jgi:arabinofuranan 3-O-arabinosyltransferase